MTDHLPGGLGKYLNDETFKVEEVGTEKKKKNRSKSLDLPRHYFFLSRIIIVRVINDGSDTPEAVKLASEGIDSISSSAR